MIRLNFDNYNIEILNDESYAINSADNNFNYDFVYCDDEATKYQSTKHGVKIFQGDEVYKSAIVCAVAGSTLIHKNSALIEGSQIYVCCANKVFCLSLPDLQLKWVTKVDWATCFGIYKIDNGLITHGELQVTRVDMNGTIIWEKGLRDIILTLDGKDSFILHKDYIELEDFVHNKYRLDFNGKLKDI